MFNRGQKEREKVFSHLFSNIHISFIVTMKMRGRERGRAKKHTDISIKKEKQQKQQQQKQKLRICDLSFKNKQRWKERT
jgi:hypothetical protein